MGEKRGGEETGTRFEKVSKRLGKVTTTNSEACNIYSIFSPTIAHTLLKNEITTPKTPR